jgi:hypothetical protein
LLAISAPIIATDDDGQCHPSLLASGDDEASRTRRIPGVA